MAKIYNPPAEIKVPKINFENIDEYDKACEQFQKELKEFLVKRNPGKNVGEIIRFPVADGYAEYMVAAMKPVELVHIPLWDAWSFEYANRLTAKDVQEKIDQQKKLEELFSSKKK